MVICGRSEEILKNYEDDFFDCCLTDPPYGLEFMGKDWDKTLPSIDTLKEINRVLKPGAWGLFMCAPRQDLVSRMMLKLEDAGFDINFTSIYWGFAQGFPKASDIGNKYSEFEGAYPGFNPKPAVEVIIVVMKPTEKTSFIQQALKNGKAITWLRECEIHPFKKIKCDLVGEEIELSDEEASKFTKIETERFPANLLVSDDFLDEEYSRFFSLDAWIKRNYPFLMVPKANRSERDKGLDTFEYKIGGGMQGTADKTLKTGSGKERNNLMKNYHPTVKPIKLGVYLLTMFSRPGDLVLEPFCGSGSFCISAKITQRQYIGIDMDANFCSIAEARLEAYEPAPLPTYFKRSKRPYKDKKSLDATVQRELDF